MRILLAPVGCCELPKALCALLSRLLHVAGRQAIRLQGPATITEGTGPPRKAGRKPRYSSVGHYEHKNEPVRPQPIAHRWLTEPLPPRLCLTLAINDFKPTLAYSAQRTRQTPVLKPTPH